MAFALACFAEAEAITVRLADDGRALLNPDMGLTMHYYANGPYYGNTLEPGDALDWFPGCSVVYLRLPWADLEPDEGAFNWSAVDTPAQQWLARGGQVAFRVTVSETSARATPEWVRAAGARTINWEYKGRSLWDPVPDDPIFLDKFGNFLRAFAARYDGRREVAFVDIGSVGIWGEGHTFRSIKLSREETQRIVRLHIDLHKRHFKKTRLIANDDFTGSNTTDDSESIDYAQANGLGWRDDSIMVDSRPTIADTAAHGACQAAKRSTSRFGLETNAILAATRSAMMRVRSSSDKTPFSAQRQAARSMTPTAALPWKPRKSRR